MTESTVVPWQIYSVTISNDSSHRLELGRLLEWEVQMETLAAKVSRVCLATDAAECDTILAEIISKRVLPLLVSICIWCKNWDFILLFLERHDMKEEKYPSISVPSKLPSFQKCTLPLASSTAPVTARYGSIVPNQHYKFSLPYPDKPQYRDTFTVTVSFQLRSAKGTTFQSHQIRFDTFSLSSLLFFFLFLHDWITIFFSSRHMGSLPAAPSAGEASSYQRPPS